MTYDETLAIMAVLKAAYPNFYRDMKRSEAEGIVGLWTEMFRDEPAEVVAVAVKAHIANDKKGFPPHIGAIKEAILKIKQPDEMTEMEAWGYIQRATRNSIYNAVEEYKKLPELLQRLVGSPQQLRDWALMDADVVHSVVASNFQRSFKARATNERELLALPADVRNFMAQLAEGMRAPELPAAERQKLLGL